MAGKMCPVRQGDAGGEAACAGESCEWHMPYPGSDGACAMKVTAQRLQLVVDALAKVLAGPGMGGTKQAETPKGGSSKNPVWDDSTQR